MTEENQLDASVISEDAVRAVVREIVEGHLKTETYKHSEVSNWTSKILDEITKRLFELKKAYKFIVTVLIVQKKDVAGFHSSTGAVWNDKTDKIISHRWENKSMYCIATVNAVALF